MFPSIINLNGLKLIAHLKLSIFKFLTPFTPPLKLKTSG